MNLGREVTEEMRSDRRRNRATFLLSGAGKKPPVTTEGGLDVAGQRRDKMRDACARGGGWHPGFALYRCR